MFYSFYQLLAILSLKPWWMLKLSSILFTQILPYKFIFSELRSLDWLKKIGMKKGVFLKCNLQYTTPIIWGAELPSQMSHLDVLCSLFVELKRWSWNLVGRGGDTPTSRHYIYVLPNRVQCLFLPLWPILYLWKKGTCIVYLSLILEQGWFFPHFYQG